MSAWFDKNWINRISHSLEGFSWRSDTTANFRCPICGDSHKNKTKKRAYFYFRNGHWSMKCHNGDCQTAVRFPTFIKIALPHFYQEYKLEKLRETSQLESLVNENDNTKEEAVEVKDGWEAYCCPVSQLKETHAAVTYLKGRNIPKSAHSKVFFTDNLSKLVHEGFGIKNKYRKDGKSILPEKRMLFFLVTDDMGYIMGIQARAIEEKVFYTLMFNEGFPKVYGLGDNDPNKVTFVFEAAFCSTFVPNSLALLGATAPHKLKEFVPPEKIVMVFDNEPRSKDTIQRMRAAIDSGYRIAFWPSGFPHKDLNDYMKDGKDPNVKTILTELSKNTYSGLKAKMKISDWSRIGVQKYDRN